MAKQFFDVFPGLKLDQTTQQLFKLVSVERVTATRQKDFVRVYIVCDRLIVKDTVLYVEKAIKDQLFAGCNIRIKIYEKFNLSAQYNPEKLLHIYYDSILTELQEKYTRALAGLQQLEQCAAACPKPQDMV